MPDDTLLAAAEGGSLQTARRRAGAGPAHAGRSRARRGWCRGSPTSGCAWRRSPGWRRRRWSTRRFQPELRAALHGEARALIDDVIWKGDGKLDTLLTAPVHLHERAAGDVLRRQGRQRRRLPEGDAGSEAARGLPDPGRLPGRAGRERRRAHLAGLPGRVRARAAASASRSPIRRPTRPTCSRCSTRPPPRRASGRRIARRSPLCGACHAAFDPIGLGFENFDGVGLYRTTDHGQPVDASGELLGHRRRRPVHRACPSWPASWRHRKHVHDCMATQLFRYGYGREE